MEHKIKKIENAHEIEKRNLKAKAKLKVKEKYEVRLSELQKQFKLEIQSIITQFNDSRTQLIKKDFLMKKLISVIALQEQQNIQFRSELGISDHPRWSLIPTYEVITIIDLAKLIQLLQDKYRQPSAIGDCNPEAREVELQLINERRREAQTYTNANQSYLGLLLQGAEGVLLDRPSALLQGNFGGAAGRGMNEDSRVLLVKIQRFKNKIQELEDKIDR